MARSGRYSINECFYSLQGEGVRAGTPNVFLRFAGCNLDCSEQTHGFDCDTDFSKGQLLEAPQIVEQVKAVCAERCDWIILTGGEPTLQLDAPLVNQLKAAGFKLAIETNGTRPVPAGVDWVCVSPKVEDSALKQHQADEVKYVRVAGDPLPARAVQAKHYLLSPAFDVASRGNAAQLSRANLEWCIKLCLEHPPWRLSVQQHHIWGIR